MKQFFYNTISTDRGDFLILFNEAGIYELFFPGSANSLSCLRQELPWPGLAEDLRRYLDGEVVSWDQYPLDCSGYRKFSADLLQEVRRIPRGSVCTYRQLAEGAGSPLAWRAAGQALAGNRHPLIVPCHRVVGSDGKLGGFSGPAGWKEMLLKLEGAI